MFEIGSSLRQARERRGLQLGDVQRETRIRVRYLQALEDERFELLPGDAYVKGFLRSYADALGLESRLYLDEYAARFPQPEDPEFVPRASARLTRRRPVPKPLVLLVLLGIGGGVLAWRVDVFARTARPAPPVEAAVLPAQLVPQASVPRAKPARSPGVLRVVAVHGRCWLAVRVGSATGRPVYVGFLRKGDSMRFGVRRRLWIRIGDPTAIEVTLDGKPVSNLPQLAASVLVGPDGWRPA